MLLRQDIILPLLRGYEAMWKEFDTVIGRNYLSGMHINDSKKGLGSRVDRHEVSGSGMIGLGFF